MRFVNAGRSAGKITEIRAKITENIGPGIIFDSPPEDWKPREAASGEECTYWYVSNRYRMSQMTSLDQELYCVGYIFYEDGLGHWRKTAFCRKYDPIEGRWERQSDSEYEYAY